MAYYITGTVHYYIASYLPDDLYITNDSWILNSIPGSTYCKMFPLLSLFNTTKPKVGVSVLCINTYQITWLRHIDKLPFIYKQRSLCGSSFLFISVTQFIFIPLTYPSSCWRIKLVNFNMTCSGYNMMNALIRPLYRSKVDPCLGRRCPVDFYGANFWVAHCMGGLYLKANNDLCISVQHYPYRILQKIRFPSTDICNSCETSINVVKT